MLKLKQCSLSRGEKNLFSGLDWEITPGEVWGVLGANGVGKSSLLLSMANLLPLDQGHIELNGRKLAAIEPKELARNLAYLPQEHSADFPIRVADWAMLSRYPHQGMWGRVTQVDQDRVQQVLAQTQLAGFAERWISELSGGERQRLALAGVLIQEAAWLLLDEPTNHLDMHYQMQLLPLLIEACKARGGGLVMSLHDVNLAAQFCSHCLLLLGDGHYLAGTKEAVLTAENISRLYRHPVQVWQIPQGFMFLPQPCGIKSENSN